MSAKTAEELMNLKPGWDGYSGVPAKLENVYLANKIAEALRGIIRDEPIFIPMGDGSIQVEYHNNRADIEVYISAIVKEPS